MFVRGAAWPGTAPPRLPAGTGRHIFPAMDAELRARLEWSARFRAAVRDHFSRAGYVEVETPVLSPFLVPEPAIEVFRTEMIQARGEAVPLYLAPSPELWMKRLIAEGSGSIFQVSRSFRNGDTGSPLHNPEFDLLEYYTVGGSYLDSIPATEALFESLLSAVAPAFPRKRLAPPFLRLTMAEAFDRFAGIDLAACQDTQELVRAGRARGIALGDGLSWEEAFHIAFLTTVEPSLPRDKPLVLLDYPALVPTTARRKTGTPWAERWELFIDGVEIANCYTEETDCGALQRLFDEETRRKESCRIVHPPDRELPGIVASGPQLVSGSALGLDRLQAVFRGERGLGGVILFPVSAIIPPHSGL
jgi:elongation factor P--(R)-beta-lysine ligase